MACKWRDITTKSWKVYGLETFLIMNVDVLQVNSINSCVCTIAEYVLISIDHR